MNVEALNALRVRGGLQPLTGNERKDERRAQIERKQRKSHDKQRRDRRQEH